MKLEVTVHFMREKGMTFSEISNELKIPAKDVALYYIKAVEARKFYEKRDTRKVVYRKRLIVKK